MAERLLTIFTGVQELIAQHAPDAVALEESFVGADARIALSVGQARGAVLVAASSAGVPCVEYAPALVKQAVCGYGRADKHQVQRMVKAILGLDELPRPNHAADALAVAIDDESKARQVMRLIDALEENDDVQDVYANFDIPEGILEAVA